MGHLDIYKQSTGGCRISEPSTVVVSQTNLKWVVTNRVRTWVPRAVVPSCFAESFWESIFVGWPLGVELRSANKKSNVGYLSLVTLRPCCTNQRFPTLRMASVWKPCMQPSRSCWLMTDTDIPDGCGAALLSRWMDVPWEMVFHLSKNGLVNSRSLFNFCQGCRVHLAD